MTIKLVDGTKVTVAATKFPEVKFPKPERKESISYNMTTGELKAIIEANPQIILKVVKVLRDLQDEDINEFWQFMSGLKIDPALKAKAGIAIKNVLPQDLDKLIAKALGIVVAYNHQSPKLFRFEGAIWKEIYVDPNRYELVKRTIKESESDIKSILAQSGWNRVNSLVIKSVVKGQYGLNVLKGIATNPVDGITKSGFDKESKIYYQPPP